MTTKKFEFPATQFGVESGLIADSLAKLNEGESISYAELTKSAGIDVIKHRNVINSARRMLQREQQKVYKALHGFGMIRLDNEQLAASGVESIKKIGRAARRAIKVTSSADYDRLSPQGKIRQMVGMSVLNLMQHTSSESNIKKIGNVVSGGRALPLQDTIAQLSS